MRLLIVEDNSEFADLLVKGLRAAGYEADVLSSIDEAGTILRYDAICCPHTRSRAARRRRPERSCARFAIARVLVLGWFSRLEEAFRIACTVCAAAQTIIS